MEDIFDDLEGAGHRPERPLPRLGLHGREHEQHDQAAPQMRDDSFATLGVRRGRVHRDEGPRASVHHERPFPVFGRAHERRLRPDDGRLQQRRGINGNIPARVGPSSSPLRQQPDPTGTIRSRRERAPRPAAHAAAGAFVCNIPRAALASTAPRAGPGARRRSTATACSGRTPRSTPATCRRWRMSTTSSSARPSGSACPTRTRDRDRDPAGLLELPVPHRPPAAVDAEPALPRPPDEGPERLRDRTPPSRTTPGIRSSTAATSSTTATARAASSGARSWRVAPDFSAACSVSRHELLDAAQAQHRLRRPTRRSSTLPTRTSSIGRSSWRSPRCSGTAPTRTATRTT